MSKVAFVGLGVMGYPMAGHLSRAGHEVTVYNRTLAKAENWLKDNDGESASSARAAAVEAEFVFTCVGDDDDLRAVVLGSDGVLADLPSGAILVDHTTTSDKVAVEIAEACSERSVDFMDAPVSGGQAGAENAALSVMCGATAGVFERARPVIESYARSVVRIGDIGSGQLTKMVNQICIAGLLQGLAEGLNFGARAGLDLEKSLRLSQKGRRNRGRWTIAPLA